MRSRPAPPSRSGATWSRTTLDTAAPDAEARLATAERELAAGVGVLDAVEWVDDRLVPSLTISHSVGSVAVHPTCASRRLGVDARIAATATCELGMQQETGAPYTSIIQLVEAPTR